MNIADFASCGMPSSTNVGLDNLNPAGVQAATGELEQRHRTRDRILATMHQPVIVQSLHTPAKRRYWKLERAQYLVSTRFRHSTAVLKCPARLGYIRRPCRRPMVGPLRTAPFISSSDYLKTRVTTISPCLFNNLRKCLHNPMPYSSWESACPSAKRVGVRRPRLFDN